MKYKNLHFIKFFFVMILLVIFLAVLILGFCWFFYLLPIDFPGTVGEWITGLSALAGGALTLGGVWWTIKDNNDQKKNELSIQFKPYLKLLNSPVKITDENILNEIFYSNHITKTIILQNSGRGEAIVTSTNISSLDNIPKSMINISCSLAENYINTNEETKLNLEIYSDDFYSLITKDKIKTKYKIKINYTDLFKNKNYSKEIIIDFHIIKYSLSSHPTDNECQESYEITIY